MGDDTFIENTLKNAEQFEREAVTIDEVIEKVVKLYGLTEGEIVTGGKQRYLSEARGLIAYLVRETSGLSLTELGKRLKRDVCSLSQAAYKVNRCSTERGELERRKKKLQKELMQIHKFKA